MPSNNPNLDKIAPSYMDGSNMNHFINNAAWNRENDDLFSSFFNPGSQQMEEYAQQLQLLGLEQDYAVKGKYQDMMDIGINPNLAAAGIAGSSGSPSAPATNTSVGSGAQSIGAAGQAIGNIGAAAESLSHANERNTLLNESLNNLSADTYLKWKEAGWNDIQSKSMALAMRYMPAEKMLGIMNLAASTEKIHGEYLSFMQGIEESKKRMSQIDAEIELAKAQRDMTTQLKLEAEKRTLGIDIENQQKQWRLDKMKELNVDPNNPIEYNMFIGALEGNQDVVDKGANIIYDSQYAASKGQFSAEAEKAYEIELNRTKGKEEGEKEYRENRQWFKEHEAQVKAYWDFMYKIPSSIREYLLKGTMKRFNLDGVWFNGNGGAPPMPTQLSK